ncbi:MAG: polyribonucleotide nucleotidyltransferase [Planctomycetes bacterium]|nr:polyribonucleotide nucleotidyltransferase [Planctomycetota bacterium]
MTQLNHPIRVSREIGGRTLTFETGRMAKQADGAVFATYGETALLATAQSAAGRPDIDFFPLTVEYREKTYAAGKVPGGFFKREMRPRDNEVLVCRSIDRPVRPMFAETYRNEVQIIVTVVSYDRSNEPDMLAGCAAMAALHVSSIPYQGPGATVRVGYVDGQYVLNPTGEQMANSTLDLVVSGTRDAVTMVEAGALDLPEDVMVDAILFGHEGVKLICEMADELRAKSGSKPKQEVKVAEPNPYEQKVEAFRGQLAEAMKTPGKHAKKAATKAVEASAAEQLLAGIDDAGELAAAKKKFGAAFHDLEGSIERGNIIQNGVRADGRKLDQIRPIEVELGVLARTHGSALFTRGETQALVSVTLGTGRDEQIIDGLGDEYSKRFMLHYNFPPFCVGEVKRMMGTSRREIGHGNLAERTVNMVMPTPEDFPYSVRVVSEILESNGSSSMASVCGASLALMDAGCPLKAPVAGIAMGLIEDGSDHYILSDILGSEDHNGDMDFKVTGTASGVTALQMDIKIKGLSADLLRRALAQARAGRLHILGIMNDAIAKARESISKWAPQITTRNIPVDKIGMLIGPGGKVIRQLQSDYRVRIEVNDEGLVSIASGPEGDMAGAVAAVEAITGDAEIGAIYKGKVVSIREFGAFVEIFPGKEGLLHISNISKERVKDVHDVLKVGQELDVKCISIDDFGRIRLANPEVEVDLSAGPGGGDRGPRRERTPRELPHVDVGTVYEGPITGVKSYGVFVEVVPGREGLCHVSEMLPRGLREPSSKYNEGDEVKVKLLEVEDGGKLRLSMRAAAAEGEGGDEAVASGASSDSGRRRRRRGGSGGDRTPTEGGGGEGDGGSTED